MSERLRAREWTVRPVPHRVADEMVTRLHYARGGPNTTTYAHGLFRVSQDLFDGQCLGVACWLPPTKPAALATYPADWKGVLSLTRLAVEPEVPRNACSFLIARSRRLIDRERWPCLVTYADEWRGHCGAIYLADNWIYVGRTKPERTYTLNGRMVARKAGPRTRTHGEMLAMGAVCEGSFAKHKFIRL